MKIVRNTGRADAIIEFIEKLKITIGKTAGHSFKLRPFQRDFIRAVYEPADATSPDTRIVRRAVLSLARKNGKSELAAALILVHLIGPESEMNGEIYSAANDREQAAIVFNAVKRLVEASPALLKYLTISAATKTIYVHNNKVKAYGSKFRALSAEAGTKHGLNPSLVVYDELAQAKNRELLDTLLTSQGARAEPLFLVISTQSHDPTHPLTEMLVDGLTGADPTVVACLHAADDECGLLDEAQWLKANPALGDFRSYEEMKIMAERAKRLPSEEQAFRLLYLNQRVAPNATLITAPDWAAVCPPRPERPEDHLEENSPIQFERGERIYLALDMSVRFDLTALVAVSADDGSRVKSWFFKPLDHFVEHGHRDGKDYTMWANQGWVTPCPGRSVDPRTVAAKIAELHAKFEIVGLAYDRFRMDELIRCLDDADIEAQEGDGFGLRLVPWGQGFASMAGAVDAFEHAVLMGELKSDGNPCLSWNVLNAEVISDPAGNRKLDKSKSRFRIDGAVSLAMALGLKAKDLSEPPPTSPWEDDGFKIARA